MIFKQDAAFDVDVETIGRRISRCSCSLFWCQRGRWVGRRLEMASGPAVPVGYPNGGERIGWFPRLRRSISIFPLYSTQLMGAFTANFGGIANNRWGFWVDFTWLDISGKQGLLNVDFEYIQSEVDGFYRMPTGLGDDRLVIWCALLQSGLQTQSDPLSPRLKHGQTPSSARAGTCRSRTNGTCCSEVMSVDSVPDRISPGKQSRWSTGSHGDTRPSTPASAPWPSTMSPGAVRTISSTTERPGARCSGLVSGGRVH